MMPSHVNKMCCSSSTIQSSFNDSFRGAHKCIDCSIGWEARVNVQKLTSISCCYSIGNCFYNLKTTISWHQIQQKMTMQLSIQPDLPNFISLPVRSITRILHECLGNRHVHTHGSAVLVFNLHLYSVCTQFTLDIFLSEFWLSSCSWMLSLYSEFASKWDIFCNFDSLCPSKICGACHVTTCYQTSRILSIPKDL